MMEWISVKDRLPEKRVPVLIAIGKEMAVMEYIRTDKKGTFIFVGFMAGSATICSDYVDYWMPLPKPPGESNGMDQR